MKRILPAIVCFALALVRPADVFSQQRLSTRTGFVGFYSKTALEDIKAENNQVFAIVEPGTKKMAFSLLVKGFIFAKELMQEHFNENYVESDKYPKSTFSGIYTGDVDLTKDGVYKVTVKGDLTLHNVTKPVEAPATMEVKGGHLIGMAEFKAKPEDYNITIPSIVRDKIDKQMTVKVRIDCPITK
ncbi:MAG: YceI family protein [Bacteroidetes bacterium]|nr:YceI family protein [Bacteroidota bacterium]